eukprot:CAMPEP_0113883838 /NCGR_PEP_ID=MMETSP0780_2-20120614/9851_1 /TAXON_ID=652834 /ORGANISM="Palpitomonas bilix" /LENGTH=283 /DNA_ID=CAMNT_0000871245 /DNA_START=59 /DNA_END=910 /DNA_ORIENTATION=+ /assembly_acc=CAM_ASM_000599
MGSKPSKTEEKKPKEEPAKTQAPKEEPKKATPPPTTATSQPSLSEVKIPFQQLPSKSKVLMRQLYEEESWTYTFLLADEDSKEAVIIDPVKETFERDCAIIDDLELKLKYALNTHVHADHITSAASLREKYGCKTAVGALGGAKPDLPLEHGMKIEFGKHHLECRYTPGHTDGCMTFVLDDQSMAFTGDALLIRGCGRTDFQAGSSEKLYDSIHQQIFTLPDSCLLYPGHDYKGRYVTSVGEEKKLNPRLTKDKAGFVELMANLGLPHPKKIKESVPANLELS